MPTSAQSAWSPLKPDLVVAHELLNSRVIPTLRRLKLRVLSANPKDFDKLFAFILQIGEAAACPNAPPSWCAR
jgi:hypothetical protein